MPTDNNDLTYAEALRRAQPRIDDLAASIQAQYDQLAALRDDLVAWYEAQCGDAGSGNHE